MTVGRAALVAGALSGVPSTLHAAATRRPLLESTRAAGTLLGRTSLPRGVLAHAAISTWWAGILTAVLPSRHTVAWSASAGLAIGALDLAIAARWFPAIRRLPAAAHATLARADSP